MNTENNQTETGKESDSAPLWPQLPKETAEAVAARHMALLPSELHNRMHALHHRAQGLLRAFGEELLAVRRESNATEEAVNAFFGSTPHDWECRFVGTSLEAAQGILGLISEMADQSHDPDKFIESVEEELAVQAAHNEAVAS